MKILKGISRVKLNFYKLQYEAVELCYSIICYNMSLYSRIHMSLKCNVLKTAITGGLLFNWLMS